MLTRRELGLLCLAFLLTLPAVTTRLYASDEIEHFAWLRSLAFDRDVNFENEYQYFFDAGIARSPEFQETFLERRNEAGRRINYAPIGAAVMWAPFYAAGHGYAAMTGAPLDGFSHPYIAAVAYGSACYGFGAVLLSAAIARRLLGKGLAASLIIAAGTPLIFYSYVAPGFGHAASAFCVSLFVWTWLRARERWSIGDAIGLGLAGGLMALVREQDVLLAAGPGLDFLLHARESLTRYRNAIVSLLQTAAAGTAAFVAAVSPQLLAYKALNGHVGQTTTAAAKMSWASPHGLSVLFNPEHGFLAWTPLAIPAIVGLIRMAYVRAEVRRVALISLLMIAAQAYTSGVVVAWTVAGSFGQRRFIALTPLLTIGLAGAIALHSELRRLRLVVVIAICVWWNLGLMALFGMHRMDRQKLDLSNNAHEVFLSLPVEAPRIAWQYLTDRSSFYRRPRQ